MPRVLRTNHKQNKISEHDNNTVEWIGKYSAILISLMPSLIVEKLLKEESRQKVQLNETKLVKKEIPCRIFHLHQLQPITITNNSGG